jgi:hypothetical protein
VSYPEFDLDEVDGLCSMTEAVNTANGNFCHDDCGCGSPGWDYIHLNPGEPHPLAREMRFTDDVVILGNSSNNPSLNGTSSIRGIVAVASATVHVYDVKITGFGRGAVVADQWDSGVWLVNTHVHNNSFVIGGGQNGSIMASNGAFVGMDGARVYNNVNNIKGGGVYVYDNSAAYAYNTIIENNTASQYGGGVFTQAYFSCRNNSIIRSNRADIRGGGIYKNSSGTLSLSSCSVTGNSAPSSPNIFQ